MGRRFVTVLVCSNAVVVYSALFQHVLVYNSAFEL